MPSTYIARQPIFNAKRHTLGYELLFRDGENNAFPAHIESNRATYRLIAENFLSFGTNPSISQSRCFINFPYESLIRKLPLTLPKDKIVVEVLETCPPTDELLLALKALHQAGYLIALDDFVYTPEWSRFLPFVRIIKVDLVQMGLEGACQMVKEMKEQGTRKLFLAEKVESIEEFHQAKEAGFSFFQGYFFSKPEVLKQRYVSPEYLIAMQLFQEICQHEVDFAKLESIVTQDVTLSFKLLKFVNTMSDRVSVQISSFRQALVYLGQERLKMFLSLALASYVSGKKPRELYTLSLQRAQFCQQMSRINPFTQHRERAFMIGLFSMLDSLLDVSIETIVDDLPVDESIKDALISRTGPYGLLLQAEESFERGEWSVVKQVCQQLDLDYDLLVDECMQAQVWSQEVSQIS
ncbi:EAL and HDOD domain-containing protein [Vibrio agarivorans]|uniref:EAL domain-containing protein n=1 Tax=Vibrio agarivorans TaxID=153622 RepID=A0ABT7Y3J5_9VIBR|nr:EAL and HDOD domain-containing protein [Vibrio agarivorans]MDN2482344.1 EAL domain-containing protein [Vibrio agarivorans]